MHNLTVEAVEKAVGEPAKKWPKRCYEIAFRLVDSGILKAPSAIAVYGHWTGPVHPGSPFAGRKRAGFVAHGWVLIPEEGIVVDPTRWVFEAALPYIFIGSNPDALAHDIIPCACGHIRDEHEKGFFQPCTCCNCEDFESTEPIWYYDEGGNLFREKFSRRPPPRFDPTRKVFKVDFGEASRWVHMLLASDEKYTDEQLFWLANLPYKHLGYMVHAIYKGIINIGLPGLIPLDNRRRAEREYGEKK